MQCCFHQFWFISICVYCLLLIGKISVKIRVQDFVSCLVSKYLQTEFSTFPYERMSSRYVTTAEPIVQGQYPIRRRKQIHNKNCTYNIKKDLMIFTRHLHIKSGVRQIYLHRFLFFATARTRVFAWKHFRVLALFFVLHFHLIKDEHIPRFRI